MSRKERIVWYIVWLIVIAAITFLIVITLAKPGLRIWPIALSISLLASWTALCAWIALSFRLRQRRKRLRGEATTDEREKMIRDKASLIGATAVIYIFWSACLILCLVYMYQGKEVIVIKVKCLALIVGVSTFVLSMSTVIVIRILRGRGTKHGQD